MQKIKMVVFFIGTKIKDLLEKNVCYFLKKNENQQSIFLFINANV